jgi:nicotinate-nucleotide--dimethylbenzimidazole phosphoribosyltransferase
VTALLDLGAGVGWVDAEAAEAARAAADPRTGRLGELVEWLAAVQGRFPPRELRRPCCIVLGGSSPAVADLAAARSIVVRDAVPDDDAGAAFGAGVALADDEIESGADLVVLAGIDASDAPATVIGLLTDTEPVALLPRGEAAVDSAAWIARAARLRDARRRVTMLRARPDELLAELGDPVIAMAAGVALQAAVRRTPVILDGTAVLAAAVLGLHIQSRASQWWQIADTSPERASRRAAERLDRRPMLDLGTDLGDGSAGLLAVELIRAALTTGRRDG